MPIQRRNTVSKDLEILEPVIDSEYKFGFVTNIEQDIAPKGLNEDIVKFISAKKNEPAFMTSWRLKAYGIFESMTEPEWHNLHYKKVDFQDISYYPGVNTKTLNSLDELDPQIRPTYPKLGRPLEAQKIFV